MWTFLVEYKINNRKVDHEHAGKIYIEKIEVLCRWFLHF